jgi:hypothetical protein
MLGALSTSVQVPLVAVLAKQYALAWDPDPLLVSGWAPAVVEAAAAVAAVIDTSVTSATPAIGGMSRWRHGWLYLMFICFPGCLRR